MAQALLALGIGFLLAIAGAFLRDILQLLPILLQLLMLVTPVVYQRTDVPQSMRFLTDYNPLFYLVESYRRIFYYGVWPDWGALAAVAIVGFLLTLLGWKLFRMARGYFEAVI
jgi:lipopolysaccharide transport system permease protein